MSNFYTRRPALQNDLYIRSEELPGTPAIDPDAAADMENEADDLVRELLIEEKRRTMPTRLPEIVPQEDVVTFDGPDAADDRESPQESIAQILKAERSFSAEDAPRKRRLPALPRLSLPALRVPQIRLRKAQATSQETQAAPTPKRGRQPLPIPAWLRNYRPTRKHIAWAVIAGLVLYRPLMVPLIVLLLFWVVLIAYLTVGPDRWGEIIGSAWQKLHDRRPELAERIRHRADRFAEKFDRVLDWLPESWADHLALPDFSVATESDEDKPDPFDRLAAEAREA